MLTKLMKCMLLCTMLFPVSVFANEIQQQLFPAITPENFLIASTPIIENADVVVLADVGKCEFVGRRNGWLALKYSRHVRIKFLNNHNFDAATFSIPLRQWGGDREELTELKAVTYNVKAGAMEEVALNPADVFIDKQTRVVWKKKFTMPAVVAGSIIDVQYAVLSDYISNLRPWSFQDDYPVLWSQFDVQLPEFFKYVFIAPSKNKYFIDTAGNFKKDFSLAAGNAFVSIYTNMITHTWVMKDLPAMEQEPYVACIDNYRPRIEFQLHQISNSNYSSLDSTIQWPSIVKTLNKYKDFAGDVFSPKLWMQKSMKSIVNDDDDKLIKAQKIFTYVQENFSSAPIESVYMDVEDLHTVMKSKKGNASALNLLLISMMQNEGISAYPVILSTRENGFTNETYPLMNHFNLTIALVRINGKDYFLDASEPDLAFGKLGLRCFNGHSRLVIGESVPLYLTADTLKEKKTVIVNAQVMEDGEWTATLTTSYGYYESMDIRRSIKLNGENEWISKQKKWWTVDPQHITLTNASKSEPVSMSFNYVLKKAADHPALIYINPIVSGLHENPFKKETRTYPVELPFSSDETYVATFEIPPGYEIEELPKNEKFMLGLNNGMYDYLIGVQDDKIMLRARLIIKKANFQITEYEDLKKLFANILIKQSEQIVLKKKQE